MMIFAAKLPRRRLAVGVSLVALLCCALLSQILPPSAATQVLAEAGQVATPDPTGVSSAQDRLDYLAGWGWQVEETPLSIEELLIPEVLDDSYTEYIALQQSQGFPLDTLTGQRVKRYSYTVTNYPTGEAGVQLNLLIHDNTVVGGEVLSPTLDGFLHGLEMP